jgi:glycosyltransferase involved in cell wall biosynthesis
MTQRELVSVIIPTRNRPELLKRAVASVVAQDYRPIQLIIIDNVSDIPVSVDSADLPCLVHRNTAMLSLAANRNLGTSLCSGSIVSFLDDDDWYLPNKLSLLVPRLEGADFCYGNTQMLGPGGEELGFCRGEGDLENLMLYRYIHPNSFITRPDVVSDIRFDDRLATYEDIDFMFRAFEKYRFRHVDSTVAVWNRDQRPDQITTRNFERSWRNHLILCGKFEKQFDRYPRVARFYYRKTALLSLLQGRMLTALRYFWKYVRYGVPLTSPDT